MFNYLVCNEHGRIPETGADHLGCAGGVRPKLDFPGIGFRSHPPALGFFLCAEFRLVDQQFLKGQGSELL